jgi:pimeloyl-ACP methyl ester carboxylesterase
MTIDNTPSPEFGLSFQHDGRRLVYDDYPPAGGDRSEAPTVVYLHGLLLDSELHRGFAERLSARGYRVVLMDLLGHGRSDGPLHASEYRIDRYADEVEALLDHLGIDQATIGGLSLGANVSLFLASRAPERVHALILEMPVLEWAVPAAALLFAPMVLAAHYLRPVMSFTARLVRRLPRTGIGPVDSALNAGSTSPDQIAAVLHGVLVGPVAPSADSRRRITAPTLVVGHPNDFIHPFNDASKLVNQIPNAELLNAASILTFRVHPERLVDEVDQFLQRQDGRPQLRAVR